MEETRCRHMGYSFRLTARVLLYAPSHRQDTTYHGLSYTRPGALARTRNSSMGPPHEGSHHERTLLPRSYISLLSILNACYDKTNSSLIFEQEREKNVLFNDALNTFYLRLYGVRHMVKDHSDSEKGNPLPPRRLLVSINSKGSFICTIPQA